MGGGTLRPDPAFAKTWRGEVVICGFPYLVTVVAERREDETRLRVLVDLPPARGAGGAT